MKWYWHLRRSLKVPTQSSVPLNRQWLYFTDVDECTADPNLCTESQYCSNNEGSYHCSSKSIHLLIVFRVPVLLKYCKCVFFSLGEISGKCWQDISRGGNFHYTTPIPFKKAYGFLFPSGGNFRDEDKSAKNYPHVKIYSNEESYFGASKLILALNVCIYPGTVGNWSVQTLNVSSL